MTPIISTTLPEVTRRDGQTFTPVVEEAFCDAPGCRERAPFGYGHGGKRRAYCGRNRPEVHQRRGG